MNKPSWLDKHDTILTAYAEAGGNGYVPIIWCIVQDGDKQLRVESLQREEWNDPELFTLFPISAAVQTTFIGVVRRSLKRAR